MLSRHDPIERASGVASMVSAALLLELADDSFKGAGQAPLGVREADLLDRRRSVGGRPTANGPGIADEQEETDCHPGQSADKSPQHGRGPSNYRSRRGPIDEKSGRSPPWPLRSCSSCGRADPIVRDVQGHVKGMEFPRCLASHDPEHPRQRPWPQCCACGPQREAECERAGGERTRWFVRPSITSKEFHLTGRTCRTKIAWKGEGRNGPGRSDRDPRRGETRQGVRREGEER
jgi:hypothetical protein